MSEVGDPDPVGSLGSELAVEQVGWAVGVLAWNGAADRFAAADPVAAQLSHDAVYGANATRWPARRR